MHQQKGPGYLIEIFLAFFKIGCFTFGGGYAMIPLIEREVITNKKWMKAEDVIDIFAVSESIPGAIAINSSAFIGYKIAGRKGAAAAMLGVITPSIIIITLIAAFFSKFQNNPLVVRAFLGIRATVVGLILLAAYKMAKAAIKGKLTILIAAITAVLVFIFNIHAIFLIISGAILGVVMYKLSPRNLPVGIKKEGEQE